MSSTSCCSTAGRSGGLYNAELGIDTGALWKFISKTQLEPWNKLLELHGDDQDTAQRQFALRVASEIDTGACSTCCGRG